MIIVQQVVGEPHSSDYRADIQGLRGVAVIAVLGVHAWPDLLRGGFVGVDIFFVLSGFLITSLLCRDMDCGRFSLGTFYRRRVLRLFPALSTVLLFCLVCACLTFPSEARQIGKHVAASAAFAANIALWQEAGYFDAASESKPLLHLWSLGIEEQFYLLWPLVLLVIHRWRQRLFAVVLLLLLASFVLNLFLVIPKAKGTFFLLPTRAWELLAGAALASLQHSGSGFAKLDSAAQRVRGSRLGRWLPDLGALTGALMIAAAFALLNKTSIFPGWWALLPTLGAVLLLAAGPTAWLNRQLLSHRVMLFYGSVSYPLYLWHWPLLVFPMLLGWPMDNSMRVLVLTLSVGLAALTMKAIERPLRFSTHPKTTTWHLVVAMVGLGVAGLALKLSDGLIGAYPREVRDVARAELAFDFGTYRSRKCFLDLEQGADAFATECGPTASSNRRLTLIWGDSHAASLYPGLKETGSESGQIISLAQFTKARCPPIFDLPNGASSGCLAVNQRALEYVNAQRPDTVVLAGFWAHYAEHGASTPEMLGSLRATVLALEQAKVQRIVVLGPLPTWRIPLPRVLLREWSRSGTMPLRTSMSLDEDAVRLDSLVKSAVAGTAAEYVSAIKLMCDAQGCMAAELVGGVIMPYVYDESHLTARGSSRVVSLAWGGLPL